MRAAPLLHDLLTPRQAMPVETGCAIWVEAVGPFRFGAERATSRAGDDRLRSEQVLALVTPHLTETWLTTHSYEGYALRQPAFVAVDVDRVVALVAVVGTMVLSGIVLGRPRS